MSHESPSLALFRVKRSSNAFTRFPSFLCSISLLQCVWQCSSCPPAVPSLLVDFIAADYQQHPAGRRNHSMVTVSASNLNVTRDTGRSGVISILLDTSHVVRYARSCLLTRYVSDVRRALELDYTTRTSRRASSNANDITAHTNVRKRLTIGTFAHSFLAS